MVYDFLPKIAVSNGGPGEVPDVERSPALILHGVAVLARYPTKVNHTQHSIRAMPDALVVFSNKILATVVTTRAGIRR